MYYRGKVLEDLTREELIEALHDMRRYYEMRLTSKDELVEFLEANRKYNQELI